MPRKKGSLNRSTMLKTVLQVTPTANPLELAKLSYDEMKALYDTASAGIVPEVKTEGRAVAITTTIPPEMAKGLFDETQRKFQELIQHYGAPEIPERVQDYLLKLYFQKSLPDAQEVVNKAIQKLEMFLLAEWGRKKIFGPRTETNLENRAKSHESAAKLLESQGNVEAAAKQRAKAESLRTEIKRSA